MNTQTAHVEKGIAALLARYGVIGLIRLAIDWLWTKAVAPQARLLRRPFYIRGMRHIRIGRNFTTGVGLRLDAFPVQKHHGSCIDIGENTQFNDYVHIGAINSVTIGNNVLIASKVFISDHNHGNYRGSEAHDSPDRPPAERPLSASPVTIEDNVWIGEFVSVLPGVRIGRGAIIGAGSVVTKDIDAGCIAVGIPARPVKRYNQVSGKWEPVKQN